MSIRPLIVLGALVGAGCGDFEIVVPGTLSAVIAPAHGSVEVSRDVEIFVAFSDPVSDADQALDDIVLQCLGAPPCQTPTASTCTAEFPVAAGAFVDSNQTARLTPDSRLQANTCFVVTVQAGIESSDQDVGPVPTALRSSFQTAP
ncbi:MAG: Ig-like domain-containing protein [Myxococcota bacterium]